MIIGPTVILSAAEESPVCSGVRKPETHGNTLARRHPQPHAFLQRVGARAHSRREYQYLIRDLPLLAVPTLCRAVPVLPAAGYHHPAVFKEREGRLGPPRCDAVSCEERMHVRSGIIQYDITS